MSSKTEVLGVNIFGLDRFDTAEQAAAKILDQHREKMKQAMTRAAHLMMEQPHDDIDKMEADDLRIIICLLRAQQSILNYQLGTYRSLVLRSKIAFLDIAEKRPGMECEDPKARAGQAIALIDKVESGEEL